MNGREADKIVGEIYHFIEKSGAITKELSDAFSRIHYALDDIGEKEIPLQQETKPDCTGCPHAGRYKYDLYVSDFCRAVCTRYSFAPDDTENVTLGKELLSEIIHYLSLDYQCKFSPNEHCDSHVDCVDCNTAKAQSTTLKRIVKEFSEWSKNGI